MDPFEKILVGMIVFFAIMLVVMMIAGIRRRP
jgi:hypothetical protein